jgi:hypothetical protein
MPVKWTLFIVVMLGDRNGWGFDETTFPPLIALMDSASPDYRRLMVPRGFTAYFLASPAGARRAERLVAQADELRTNDAHFKSLGIGISTGEMIADFTWFGRLRSEPLGTVATEAARLVRSAPDAYVSLLKSILDAYRHS